MNRLALTILDAEHCEIEVRWITLGKDATNQVPDVCVAGDFPGPYPTEPVLLCCEILSPEDRLGAMLAKCEEYDAWGVPFCWVVDPVKRTAWEYHSAAEPVRETDILRAGELSVNLEELFSALDAAH
jgi:Uma2 family endonuclease